MELFSYVILWMENRRAYMAKISSNRHKSKNMWFSFGIKPFMIIPSVATEKSFRGETIMNTDKIYAEAIANEYAPKKTSKVIALKKLDRKAKSKAHIFAYTFGIVMALVLGVGMCLSMHVIGGNSVIMTSAGILLGFIGIAGISLNYPIYKKMLTAGKEKYAFEIIQLAKEISDSAE